MGQYAEMLLDGTCCQVCGEFMDDGEDGDGFPVTCDGCGGNDWEDDDDWVTVRQETGEKQMDYILRLKGLGFTNKQIASMTGLSLRGLKKKLRNHYAENMS